MKIKNELLTPAEVAKELRLALGTVRRWLAERKLPVVKVGRSNRVKLADLEKFLRDSACKGGS